MPTRLGPSGTILIAATAAGLTLSAAGHARAQTPTPAQARVLELYRRGEDFWNQNRLAEAIREYEQAVTQARTAFGTRSKTTADLTNNLAHIYTEAGQYARAEPLYKESLSIREQVSGPDSREVAICLNNLGELYRQMGRYGEAEPVLLRCLRIKETLLGPDHPNVALTLNNLADLYRDWGRYAEALPRYDRTLKILRAKVEPDHPQLAITLDNLAHLYDRINEYEKAIPLTQQALAILEKRFGPDHRDVIVCVHNLARLYHDSGRLDAAIPLYRRSLESVETKLGPDNPNTIFNVVNQARLCAQMGRWPEALDLQDRACRSLRRHVARVLLALSEPEQLDFLARQDRVYLEQALSIGLARPDDPATVEKSAGWVLNGKVVAQQALAERALLARDRRDARLAGVVDELSAVRGRLAALSLAAPAPGQEASRFRQMADLTERERGLSKQLGEARGVAERDEPWIELDDVRKALLEDTVLVELARLDVWNPKDGRSDWVFGPARYAAWVIPPRDHGAIRLIDLGPAEAIEAAVADVRQHIQPSAAALQERGEPELATELRGPLDALARRVLVPLLPHIAASRRWLLSPDAALWLVPWAALPLETDKDRYAVEDHAIGYVVSGRELAGATGKPPSGRVQGQALVMADPDYDLDPAAARQAARQVLREGNQGSSGLVLRGLSRAFRRGAVPPLPGTAAEAQAIAPKLQAYTGVPPIVYTQRWALEPVFKAFRRPRAVVLCTHGFFLDDQTQKPSTRDLMPGSVGAGSVSTKPDATSENPLLRCGLLLAGCNREPAGDVSGDDGVLSGLEIVGTDLRGTELVVLSACQTGLGEVRKGEGVAGLRQAFQLAGAQTVVATLWQVPDRESARLMTGFFDNLAAGGGRSTADALRTAQLELIQSRRERLGAAHPFFWAAFTVTGRGM
jgi:CHAT domain-containing protein/tetratricopeptide (TPR) repeat protein